MVFLPIVERELRLAGRKRSTFWVRVAAALVALVIGIGFLISSEVSGFAAGTASHGKGLFAVLTWLSLAVALSAGLFLTSDCLSEEKREGTIGFLFLTDLRGYDVVLGKLLATSLRSFYALLALLPVLAVTLLMGGVAGKQFWRTCLALISPLLVSLAAGLFVSGLSRNSQKALAATVALLLFLAAGGPAIDSLTALATGRPFQPVLSLSSPIYLFVTAGAWGKSPFWSALLVNQIVAWTLLGLTCVLLPRTWQEKAARPRKTIDGRRRRWKFGGAKRRLLLRQKLLPVNPVLWLACRERWQAVAVWVAAFLMAGGLAAFLAVGEMSMWWIIWNYLGSVVILGLYLAIASQAGRFFVEARRNGLMELLLATPVTPPEIVQGQWRALLRMFGPALALCLAAQLIGEFMAAVATARTVAAAGSGGPGPSPRIAVAVSTAGTLTVAANFLALIWFGMWMGLTSKSNHLAALKTITFVQIIPWLVISFVSMLLVPLLLFPLMRRAGGSAATTPWIMWYQAFVAGVALLLFLAKNLAFILWARRRLRRDFRARAGPDLKPIRQTPPSLPPSGAPPVIATG